MLRNGLTENYLIPEANAASVEAHPELMSGTTFEDFLGPEMAKTNK